MLIRAGVCRGSGRLSRCWGVYTSTCSFLSKNAEGSFMQKSEEQTLLTRSEVTQGLHNDLAALRALSKSHFFPSFSLIDSLGSTSAKEISYLPPHSRGGSFYPEKRFWTALMEKGRQWGWFHSAVIKQKISVATNKWYNTEQSCSLLQIPFTGKLNYAIRLLM